MRCEVYQHSEVLRNNIYRLFLICSHPFFMKFFVNKLLRFIICGVCWDSDMIEFPYCCMKVSMPHAVLCVSGLQYQPRPSEASHVSMPHATLCVSGQSKVMGTRLKEDGFNAARGMMCVGTYDLHDQAASYSGFNAARSIMCVGTCSVRSSAASSGVSMPHAALCVSGL